LAAVFTDRRVFARRRLACSLLIIVGMKTALLTKGALAALALAGGTAVLASRGPAPAGAVAPVTVAGGQAQSAGPLDPDDAAARNGTTGTASRPGDGRLGVPEKVFEIPYGARANELGGEVPPEGLAECPGAVSVAEDGTMYILDQINERIVKMHDGRENELIDLPARTFFDLSIAPDGTLVLLDKFVGESIALVDPTGQKPSRELSVRNKYLEEPGAISGVYARADGVWIEQDNQLMVQIADQDGKATLRRQNGRFSRDGSRLLRAGIVNPRAIAIWQQPVVGGPAIETEVPFDTDVDYITQVATDANNHLFLVVALVDEPAPGQTRNAHTEVVVLDRGGHEQARTTLPARDESWLQGRAYEVSADGSLYHLSCGPHSATMWRVSL
jgi:hypothetical protein